MAEYDGEEIIDDKKMEEKKESDKKKNLEGLKKEEILIAEL